MISMNGVVTLPVGVISIEGRSRERSGMSARSSVLPSAVTASVGTVDDNDDRSVSSPISSLEGYVIEVCSVEVSPASITVCAVSMLIVASVSS